MRRMWSVAAGMLVCGMLAGTARATTYGHVTAQYAGLHWADYVYLKTTAPNAYDGGTYAGDYKFNKGSTGNDGYASQISNPFYAYCIDVYQFTGGWYNYEIKDLELAPLGNGAPQMGPVKANYLRELFYRWHASVDTVNEGEAFGACVWEITFEDTGVWNINDGNVIVQYVNNPGLVQTYLSSLTGQYVGDTNLYALVNPGTQDFALYLPGSGGFLIPEPLTLLAVGSAVAGLAGYIRRRRLGPPATE